MTNLEAGAIQVRNAADELCKRIELFQEYLNKLQGRVETVLECDGFTLRLHHKGKRWILSYKNDYTGNEWKPLLDGALTIKLLAVKAFPDLLLSIEHSQAKLIEQIRYFNSEFDKFWERLNEAD